MLIVAGQFVVEPDKRDDFLRSREEGMRKSRSEPGCITYVFSADPIEPNLVYLFERWESKEALAAHLAGLASAPRSADVPGVTMTEILQYDIASVGPVGS